MIERRAAEARLQAGRFIDERFQDLNVGERIGRRDARLIGGRKGALEAPGEGERARLVMTRGEGVAEGIRPGAHGARHELLDGVRVDFARVVGIRAHEHVGARQHGVGELHLRLDRLAVEGAHHDRFDALARLGVVPVARDVDEAGVEAAERVAPYEQAQLLAFVQIDDAANDRDEIVDARLKQLVARKGFQDVQHGLGVVTLRAEPELVEDLAHLVAQHRNFARALAVRARSPKAQEAVLAIHRAARVEGLEAHVVEIAAAMHGRNGIRLGDDEQRSSARAGADVAAQQRRPHSLPSASIATQDPEPAFDVGRQGIAAAAALQPVVAIAEEREVIRFHPFDERARFLNLAARQRRRRAFQFRGERTEPAAHRLPVGHRYAHIVERRAQARERAIEAHRVEIAIDLEQLPGLGTR